MSASRDGNGMFARAYDWTDDAANSIPITASRFDTEMDGVAAELTNSVAADGQTTMSGNLKMGGFKITNVADGTVATDGVSKLQAETIATAATTAARLPVGSIYMNKTNATNPGTLLGYGTWVAIEDKFLVSRGGTYTATGGAATQSLSSANNGAHVHSITTRIDQAGADNYILQEISSSIAGSQNTESSGSGTAFSIIPPYQAIYTWERTV